MILLNAILFVFYKTCSIGTRQSPLLDYGYYSPPTTVIYSPNETLHKRSRQTGQAYLKT